MEGSMALLLFAAFFRFVDRGEGNARDKGGGPAGWAPQKRLVASRRSRTRERMRLDGQILKY